MWVKCGLMWDTRGAYGIFGSNDVVWMWMGQVFIYLYQDSRTQATNQQIYLCTQKQLLTLENKFVILMHCCGDDELVWIKFWNWSWIVSRDELKYFKLQYLTGQIKNNHTYSFFTGEWFNFRRFSFGWKGNQCAKDSQAKPTQFNRNFLI